MTRRKINMKLTERYNKACSYCKNNRDKTKNEKMDYLRQKLKYSDSGARSIINQCRTEEEKQKRKKELTMRKKEMKENIPGDTKTLRERLEVIEKYEEERYISKHSKPRRSKLIFDDSRL